MGPAGTCGGSHVICTRFEGNETLISRGAEGRPESVLNSIVLPIATPVSLQVAVNQYNVSGWRYSILTVPSFGLSLGNVTVYTSLLLAFVFTSHSQTGVGQPDTSTQSLQQRRS